MTKTLLSLLFITCCIMLINGVALLEPATAQTDIPLSQIAFVSERDGNQEIYLMNGNGGNQVNLTNNPANDWLPAWSPDGSRLAFTSNRDGNEEIYLMDAAGFDLVNLTNAPEPDNAPTWSPDGTQIAWVSERGGRDIWIINIDGTGLTQITTDGQIKADPSWSPDGQTIVYWQVVGNQTEIFSINIATRAVQQLTNNTADDGWPRWYADNSIVFDSFRDGNWEVYSMNADGSNQINLSNNPAIDGRPGWSAWEWRVAFTSNRDGNSEVYTMFPDGSGLNRITNNNVEDHSPVWRPNPQVDPTITGMTAYLQFTYTPDRMVLFNPTGSDWMFLSDVNMITSDGGTVPIIGLTMMFGDQPIARLAPGECIFWRADTASETPTEDCQEVLTLSLPTDNVFWSQGFQITNVISTNTYVCPVASETQRTRCILPR